MYYNCISPNDSFNHSHKYNAIRSNEKYFQEKGSSVGGNESSKKTNLYDVGERKAPLSQNIDKGYRGKYGKSNSRSKSRSPSASKSHHHSHKSRKRSHSREKIRSKSKERKHRSRSRERSREKRARKSRSKDRASTYKNRKKDKSRSRERIRSRDKSRERKHSPIKEKKDRHSGSPSRRYIPVRGNEERKSRSRSPFRPKMASKAALKFIAQQSKESIAAKLAEVTKNAVESEKTSNLPLNLLGNTTMTPQLVLQQTMAAMNAQAQSLTGVALPKYYNPAAVNPLKYAEQMQKRKLLWRSKEKPESQPKSNSIWAQTHFNQDQDGKMSAKFRKLMGLKDGEEETTEKASSSVSKPEPATGTEVIQKQEALFRDLDHQYEMARITTHTQRGVGLGYSSQPQTLIYPK